MHINSELAEIQLLRHRQQELEQRDAQGRGYPSGIGQPPSHLGGGIGRSLLSLADPLRDHVDPDPWISSTRVVRRPSWATFLGGSGASGNDDGS